MTHPLHLISSGLLFNMVFCWKCLCEKVYLLVLYHLHVLLICLFFACLLCLSMCGICSALPYDCSCSFLFESNFFSRTWFLYFFLLLLLLLLLFLLQVLRCAQVVILKWDQCVTISKSDLSSGPREKRNTNSIVGITNRSHAHAHIITRLEMSASRRSMKNKLACNYCKSKLSSAFDCSMYANNTSRI